MRWVCAVGGVLGCILAGGTGLQAGCIGICAGLLCDFVTICADRYRR